MLLDWVIFLGAVVVVSIIYSVNGYMHAPKQKANLVFAPMSKDLKVQLRYLKESNTDGAGGANSWVVFLTVITIASILMFFDYPWLRVALFVASLVIAWFMEPRKYFMILMSTTVAFWNFMTLFFKGHKLLVGDYQIPGIGIFIIILITMYAVYYVVKVLMVTRKSDKTDPSHIT